MSKNNRSKNYNKHWNKNGKPSNNKSGNNKPGEASKNANPAVQDEASKTYDRMITNDISWYNKNKNMFDLATKVPFNQILGREVDLVPNIGDFDNTAIPGIMRLDFIPGIGIAENHMDAPNRAFQAMYSALLSKTSTSALSFTPANLALLVISEQSIAMNIAVVKRALAVANLYTPQNMYYCRAILDSMHWDVQDTLDHRGDYTWKLNNIIRDFNTLRIPNFIDTFKRHYFLSKNLFADQDSIQSQLYYFQPAGYYVYSDLGYYNSSKEFDGVARAKFLTIDKDQYLTIQEMLDIIGLQIAAIRNSSDFGVINGTLQRAFPENQFVTIEEATVSDIVVPLVDSVMSYQIHNATIGATLDSSVVPPAQPDLSDFEQIAGDYNSNVGDIVCDYVQNLVKYAPALDMSNVPVNVSSRNQFVLNTFDSDISPEFIMESTRLMFASTPNGTITSLGTEFISGAYIYNYVRTDEGEYILQRTTGSQFQRGWLYPDSPTFAADMAKLERFHKAPRWVIYDPTTRAADITGDLNLFTMVSTEALEKLHLTALLSIFDTKDSVKVQ